MADVSKLTLQIDAVTNLRDAESAFTKLQKQIDTMGLPKNLQSKFDEIFTSGIKGAQKMSEAIANSFKGKGDASKFTQGLNEVNRAFKDIEHTFQTAKLDKTILNTPAIEDARQKITEYENAVKSASESLKDIKYSSKSFNAFKEALASGDIKTATTEINKLAGAYAKATREGHEATANEKLLIEAYDTAKGILTQYGSTINEVGDSTKLYEQLEVALNDALKQATTAFENNAGAAGQTRAAILKLGEATEREIGEQTRLNKELSAMKSRVEYFFGLQNAVNLFRRAIRSAYNDVKALDKVMTETAVVTNFSVGDMWAQLPEYTKRANALGVSIQSVYEADRLFYQQGLKTNEVIQVSTETMKMARIAGLDAATATDRMTNALRGFNMEINEASAQRINDVYSRLAAITASDVDEISTAMTKVASLANSANMEFEKTSAFLAQIIETTRESAETAGTALKTIVARFSEVKKLYSEGQLTGTDEEGEEIQVNRVATALQTAGISMNEFFLGTKGLDDILMELAEKWDSLDTVQQRYIATMAAGSRQQSRFIALMQDYKRTVELVGEAENSAGASTAQFEKTLESMESKLAKLKNSWTTFTMGIADSDIIKFFVDAAKWVINFANTLTSVLPKGLKGIANSALILGGLKAVRPILEKTISAFVPFMSKKGQQLSTGFFKGFATNLRARLNPQFWNASGIQNFEKALNNSKAAMSEFTNNAYAMSQASAGNMKYISEEIALRSTLTSQEQMYNNVMNSGLNTKQKNALLEAALTDEEVADTIAKEGVTDAELRKIAAQKGGIITTIKAKLVTMGETFATNSAIGAKISETAAQHGLNGAMTAGIAIAGIYLVLILALVAAVVALVKIYESFAEETERAEKAASAAASAASELKDKYTELKTSMEEILDLQSKWDVLLKGSDAWSNNLDDINEKIKAIIDKYPDYAKYFEVGENGKYIGFKDEAGFKAELEHTEKLANLTQGSTQIANAYAKYAKTIEEADKTAFWQAVGAGAATAVFLPAGKIGTELINNAWDKKADKAWADYMASFEGYNMLANFSEDDRFYAQGLFNNETYGKDVARQLSRLKRNRGNNYKKWDSETKKAYEQFQQEYYANGYIDKKGNIIVDGKAIENAWETFANYLVTQGYEQKVGQAKQDVQSNALLERMLNGDITEADLQYLIKNKGELGEMYQDLAWRMQNSMQTLGTALWDAGFGSEFIDGLSLKARQSVATTINNIPVDSRSGFATLIQDFWNTVDDESKDKVQEAIGATNFENLASIDTLRDVLEDTLGENGDVDNFINGLKELGIASLNLEHSIQETLTQLDVVKKSVKNTNERISEDEFNQLNSKKTSAMYISNGDGTYTFISTPAEAKAAATQSITDDLMNRWYSIQAAQSASDKIPITSTIERGYQYDSNTITLELMESAVQNSPNTNKALKNLVENQGDEFLPLYQAFVQNQPLTITQQRQLNANGGPSLFWDLEALLQGYYKPQVVDNSVIKRQAQSRVDEEYEALETALGEAFATNDYDVIESILVSSMFEGYLSSGRNTDWLQQRITGLINENPELFGFDDLSSMANRLENTGVESNLKTWFDQLNDVQYYLNSGAIEDYERVYASLSKTMTEMFGDTASAEWINTNTDLMLSLMEESEDYTEAVMKFQQQMGGEGWLGLLGTADYDAAKAQYTLSEDMVENIDDAAAAYERMGMAVTKTEDGLIITNTLLNYMNNQALNNKYGKNGSSTSDWENPYDHLYNHLAKITSLQRERNKLEREYNALVKTEADTQEAVTKKIEARTNKIREEMAYQRGTIAARTHDIYNLQVSSGLADYAWYDAASGRVNINWNKINGITDSERGKEVQDYISKMEGYVDDIDSATDNIYDLEDTLDDMYRSQLESYAGWENRIAEALASIAQQQIDELSKINDTINDTNSAIFDAAQKQIDADRQARENEKKEQEIIDKEARLAYLRRDTSGANALEIKKLEEELTDSRQSYADTLVDQALEKMREDADAASDQRAKQIELLEEQLEFDKKHTFIHEAEQIAAEGDVNKIWGILSQAELLGNKSKVGQTLWTQDFYREYNANSQANLDEALYEGNNDHKIATKNTDINTSVLKEQSEKEKSYDKAYQDNLSNGRALISTTGKTVEEIESMRQYYNSQGLYANYMSAFNELWVTDPTKYPGAQTYIAKVKAAQAAGEWTTTNGLKVEFEDEATAQAATNFYSYHIGRYSTTRDGKVVYLKGSGPLGTFATGGLVTSTGPAWLDGTKSSPEYVLNAAQTQGFLALTDVLSRAFNPSAIAGSNSSGLGGDNYYDIDIQAEIGSDYDVDQLADKIKRQITEDSMYRNVNAISFIR